MAQYIQQMARRVGGLCLLFLCFQGSLWAQMQTARAHIDQPIVEIGEASTFVVEATTEPGATVIFPTFENPIAPGIEWIPPYIQDTTQLETGGVRIRRTYSIISFDSGSFRVPPVAIVIAGDTLRTLQSFLEVRGLKVDLEEEIKPIREPLEVGYNFWDFFPWICLLLILAAIGGGGYLIFRYLRKKAENPEPERSIVLRPPPPPAHEIALKALERIKREKKWEKGDPKVFHSQLTEVIRDYIHARFGLNAPEYTTEETLQAFRVQGLMASIPFVELRQMLVLADLVKFAKAQPLTAENEQSLENAFRFVKMTIPEPEPAPIAEPAEEEEDGL